jgi:hypothetical protein
MPSESLVHFSGTWSTNERDTIREAIATFEQEWRSSNGNRSRQAARPGSRWVVVSTPLDDSLYYFAHRQGTYDSISGETASQLAEQILSQIDVISTASSNRTPDATA